MNIREKLVVAIFGYEIDLWPSKVRGQRRFLKMLPIDTILVDLNEIENEEVVTERNGEDDLEEVVVGRF